jgi:ATP synthase protein I
MKEDTKKLIRQAGWASTLGFSVAFAIFIGIALGYWLDSRFGTSPWLTLLFLIMGVIAGFRNYYRFMKKQQKDD